MGGDDDIETRAAFWFARMHAPDARDDSAAFEAWRARDARHQAAYARLERDWQRSNVLHDSRLVDSFRLRAPWWKRLGADRPRVFAPALAMIVLVVLAGVWVAHHADRPAAAATYASRVGEIRTVSLADGSRLTLDTDSVVTARFTAGERRVRLDRGRVRFDVVHDAGRPFMVIAGETQVTDLGTVFDVRLHARQVDVTLIHGLVEVRKLTSSSDRRYGAPLTLREGQRVSVQVDRPPVVEAGPGESVSGWTSGMLDFDDAPLADVLAEINRYNARHILVGDPELGSLRVTASYRPDAPADIARNLTALFELRVGVNSEGNWVLRRGRTSAPR